MSDLSTERGGDIEPLDHVPRERDITDGPVLAGNRCPDRPLLPTRLDACRLGLDACRFGESAARTEQVVARMSQFSDTAPP